MRRFEQRAGVRPVVAAASFDLCQAYYLLVGQASVAVADVRDSFVAFAVALRRDCLLVRPFGLVVLPSLLVVVGWLCVAAGGSPAFAQVVAWQLGLPHWLEPVTADYAARLAVDYAVVGWPGIVRESYSAAVSPLAHSAEPDPWLHSAVVAAASVSVLV